MSDAQPNQYHIIPRSYHRKNPRWYHTHIIDWMMANPNGKLSDCAAFVGKKLPTLSAIIRSDLFQAALEKRKREFSSTQDLIIKQKLTQVSVASLDMILDVIDKKKSSIPLETLNTVADGALKRLGYGLEQKPQPGVQVNIQNNSVAVPVSASELDAARSLMRQHQQKIASGHLPPLSPGGPDSVSAAGAAPLEGEILPPENAAFGGARPSGPEKAAEPKKDSQLDGLSSEARQ